MDFLKETKYKLLIREEDINTLKKYGIDVDNYKTLTEILYVIDDIINNEDLIDEEIEELDYVANNLQETNYYMNTNK